jgi:hypothetical protein
MAKASPDVSCLAVSPLADKPDKPHRVHDFTRLGLPPLYRTKPLKTVRMGRRVIPGRLVKTETRSRLKLPKGYHFEKTFQYAMTKIQKLKPVELR